MLNDSQLEILRHLVAEDNDATLQQLCGLPLGALRDLTVGQPLRDRLALKTGIKVSVPTMCRQLKKLNLTRKSGENPRRA